MDLPDPLTIEICLLLGFPDPPLETPIINDFSSLGGSGGPQNDHFGPPESADLPLIGQKVTIFLSKRPFRTPPGTYPFDWETNEKWGHFLGVLLFRKMAFLEPNFFKNYSGLCGKILTNFFHFLKK